MAGDAERLLGLLEERLRGGGLDPDILSREVRLGVVEQLRTRARTMEEMGYCLEVHRTLYYHNFSLN